MNRTTGARRLRHLLGCVVIALLAALGSGPEATAQGLRPRERDALEIPGRKEPHSFLDPFGAQTRKFHPPELTGVPSDVRDAAKLFSADAIRAARETLAKIEKTAGVATLIETIETLGGEPIDEVAARLARRSGLQGVFVLIAKKESKIEVLSSRRYAESVPRAVRNKVRAAFVAGLHEGDFDEGLRRGVAALETELAAAKAVGKLPQAEKPPALLASTAGEGNGKPLVIRNQVRLTLEGARTIITAAERRAASMNLKMNIAVVDDGGHLLSFDRMDGARPASGYTSLTKAVTAATFRQPTGPIPAGTTSPDPILNLSLQNAALASGGKITTLYGGVPVVIDGQVVGGVGVGGGSGEQDAQVARAGIEALLDQLKAQGHPPAERPEEAGKPAGLKPKETQDAGEKKQSDGSF
jgi:glc operon protein GlcG